MIVFVDAPPMFEVKFLSDLKCKHQLSHKNMFMASLVEQFYTHQTSLSYLIHLFGK